MILSADYTDFFALSRSRGWLARQLLVAHRSLVNKRRHDRRRLLHVVGLNPIKYVLVLVMRARVVLDLILNKLKTRKSDRVERKVICPTCV